MNNTALTCWVISDGRRGIENQALGLAEAASNIAPLDIDRHIIKNGKTFAAASPRLQFGLKSKPRDYSLPKQLPDIAIGCGRQAIAPLLALKKASASIFTAYVQDPKSIQDYKQFASKHENVWLYDGEGENPYYAFLGGADAILVTEESTNMLTEACATGKPVFRLSMSGSSGKFSSLYEDLSKRCSVAPFKGSFLNDSYAPLLETRRAAQQFWAHFEKRNAILN